MPNPNPPKPTAEQESARQLYTQAMEEVKTRLDAMKAAAMGQIPVASPLVREFSYLQLRMICETIALGCLAAHGHISDLQSQTMQNEWSADRIMKRLEKLNPEFFPRAVNMLKGETADWHFDTIKDALTKPELLKIYYRCDAALHRGGLAKFSEARADFSFDEMNALVPRFIGCLRQHVIAVNDKLVFVCVFHSKVSGQTEVKLGLAT